jgi:hypothetical protein
MKSSKRRVKERRVAGDLMESKNPVDRLDSSILLIVIGASSLTAADGAGFSSTWRLFHFSCPSLLVEERMGANHENLRVLRTSPSASSSTRQPAQQI